MNRTSPLRAAARRAAAIAAGVAVVAAFATGRPASASDSVSRVIIGDSITHMSADLIDCGNVDAIPGRASDGNLRQPLGGEFGAVEAASTAGYTDVHWVFAIGSTELHTIDSVADARDRVDSIVDAVGERGDISFVMVHHRGFPRKTLVWNTALYLTEDVEVFRWVPDRDLLEDEVHPTEAGRRLFAETVCTGAVEGASTSARRTASPPAPLSEG